MQLIRLVVCISVLATKVCWAGLVIETFKLDESKLVEVSIDFLESCYGDRLSTVGVAGPSAGSITARMSLRDSAIATTLIDDTSTVQSYNPDDLGSRYKLPVFLITTTDLSALGKTLNQLRKTKWWNHMAPFLLIGWPEVEQGCSNAYDVLWKAWKMNLLNSKFMCLHRRRGHLIYTFNPYASKAPAPWRFEDTYEGINGHIWTLFVRKWGKDGSRCDRLDFDKTIDLGGYEIRASVKGMEDWWFADPDKKPELFNRVQNVTAQILMSSMNAAWNLLLEPSYGTGIVIAGKPNRTDVVTAADSGISDICLNIIIQGGPVGYELTYPVNEDHLAILTQYPGHKSQLDKIISVLDRSSRFGVFVVFMITLLFSKFWLGNPIITAILDLVLILCNAALLRIPERQAPRIYLATLFMFVVTIQGIYQGQFASMLTKEVRLPTVNNIQDLARSEHKIYGAEPYESFFDGSAFDGRYVEEHYSTCVADILLGLKVACVEVRSELISPAANHNLHLSRETLGTIYGVYVIRKDWPLVERVNLIFGRAAAAGIMDHLYSIQRDSEMNTIEEYENREEVSGPKVLTWPHLKFAFVILGIGLGSASVTFIIEVAFFHATTRDPRNRIRRPINRIHR